jgi:hypothetical protein
LILSVWLYTDFEGERLRLPELAQWSATNGGVASKNERPATVKVTRPPERRLGPILGTDRLMTMAEVSDLLGIPISTLYGWRHRGEGPAGYRIPDFLIIDSVSSPWPSSRTWPITPVHTG